VPWFFRAIETAHGRWECRHGALLYDDHATLDDALDHLRSLIAGERSVVQVFVHPLDGEVRAEDIV
jgi:hypothetical protein